PAPRCATPVPYTTLFRSRTRGEPLAAIPSYEQAMEIFERIGARVEASVVLMNLGAARVEARDVDRGRADLQDAARRFVELGGTKDRKSTRLNSSHEWISY